MDQSLSQGSEVEVIVSESQSQSNPRREPTSQRHQSKGKRVYGFPLNIPVGLHDKLTLICETYGFRRKSQNDMVACLTFLIEAVANDPKTKELRLRQLYDESIDVQQKIAKLRETL
ncbi:MAG: hypothetical protein M1368_12705 [Thaumarchaeota archaeon]|nr:hypothetical protein [Nitrososphaerota archaeon]